jgi:hypothetical protein
MTWKAAGGRRGRIGATDVAERVGPTLGLGPDVWLYAATKPSHSYPYYDGATLDIWVMPTSSLE